MDNKTTFEIPCAQYTEQRIPQYRGNPLIEALPPIQADESWIEQLFAIPEFHAEQRDWLVPERMHMIAQLANFMIPLPRHIQLAQSLSIMIHQGYVGRAPRSANAHRTMTQLHDQLNTGHPFRTSSPLVAQLSSSLIGVSGMGKTTTVKRILSRMPGVIHHQSLGIYQIPSVHIEMPYDGASVSHVALSIFAEIDKLLPEANYLERYSKTKANAGNLMTLAATALGQHCVGLLVVDEIQNLENSSKNRQDLMTLLVSASNTLGVPILFIGTNKARRILSADFRQARRSIGHGFNYFDRLNKGTSTDPSEWEDFVNALWRFQWVRNPVPENQFLTDLLYEHSQGIVDIAIKLFAASQMRAMLDGSETLTGQLIADVAKHELYMVEPMIDALRRNDIEALQKIDDIAPLALDSILKKINLSYSGKKTPGTAIKPDNELFVPNVSAALEVLGFDQENAISLAESVAEDKAINALEGLKKAISTSTSGPRAKSRTSKKAAVKQVEYAPGDYRNALAKKEGETSADRLKGLGLLPDLEKIIGL